jgi:hypothetical protein
MDIDAVLILVSFVSFLGLLVSWILAPLRAAAPMPLAASATVESAAPAALAA